MAPGKMSEYQLERHYAGTAIEKVVLPDKIKCQRCSKIKSYHSYSNGRQLELKAKIYNNNNKRDFNPTTTAFIVCNMCTGGQVTELYCIGCDKVKGKTAFSNAQRKKPDEARCWPCMEEKANMEPGGSDSDISKSGSGGGSDSDDDDYYGSGSTVAGTFSNLSLANGSSAGTTGGGVSLAGNGGGSYQSKASSSVGNSSGGVPAPRTPSVISSTPTERTTTTTGLPPSFNPDGYRSVPAHMRKKGPASVASDSVAPSSGGGKFAKIKAVPQRTMMDMAQRQREQEQKKENELDQVTVADSDDDSD